MSLLLGMKFADPPAVGYDKEQLEEDLKNGVSEVVAGIGSDYRLYVDTTSAYIALAQKDAVFRGTAAAGSVKPALGISAAGIAMGYNRASDGQWVDSVAITASGDATFSGNVNASGGNITGTVNVGDALVLGSNAAIYSTGKPTYASTNNGLWVGYDGGTYKVNIGGASSSLKWDGSALYINGVSAGTVVSGAASGATSVQPAAIAGMLTASSSYILGGAITVQGTGNGIKTGDLTWNASGVVTSGSGVAVTDKGIVGAWQGTTTFSINGTTGAAIFKGDITGASGAFSGTVSASNLTGGIMTAAISIRSAGYILSTANAYYSSYNAAVWAEPSASGMHGVVGYLGSSSSGVSAVYGYSASASCPSVSALNFSGGFALQVYGKMSIDNSTLVTNFNADYLDGYHGTSYVRFPGTTLPQTATINGRTAQWAEVTVNGTTYYLLAS